MSDYSSNTYNGYDYSGESSGGRVNGLELIVIIVMLISIITSGVLGYFAGNRENQDAQKSHDIAQVIKALDYFYAVNNAYPIRQCSEDLNPIDFELALQRNLTGRVARIGTLKYLNGDLPRDFTGQYTNDFNQYIYNLPCASLVQDSVAKTGQIYQGGTEACNYNRSVAKTQKNPNGKTLFRCYLYTSSVTGDRYSIGYYSETLSKFVIFTRFRTEKIVLSYS